MTFLYQCSQFLDFSSLLIKQKSYRVSDGGEKMWVSTGTQCELNNEFWFHAAYSRSLDTVEPCRADKSQYNKGQHKNTSNVVWVV